MLESEKMFKSTRHGAKQVYTNQEKSLFSLSKLYIEESSLQDNLPFFHKELLRLLQRKDFLPAGGILGFGLKHKYNYSAVDSYLHGGGIRGLRGLLRTTDKILFALAQSCGLKGELGVVYKMKDYPGVSMLARTLSPFPNQPYPYSTTWVNTDGCQGLCQKIGGNFIEISSEHSTGEPVTGIKWVSPILHTNIMPEFIVMVEGNPIISHIRGSYVLTMTVPRWSEERANETAKAANPIRDSRAVIGGSREAGEIPGSCLHW